MTLWQAGPCCRPLFLLLLALPAGVRGLLLSRRAFVAQSTSTAVAAGWSATRAADGVAAAAAAAAFEGELKALLGQQPELAGTFLRLAFHDAVTRDRGAGGPNGSIRLPDEQRLRDNRHLGVALEYLAPLVEDPVAKGAGALSWADAIALAGAVSVTSSGGPRIRVALGRADSTQADPAVVAKFAAVPPAARSPGDRAAVVTTLPSAGLDSDGLRRFFGAGRFGLSDEEIVALCGAHTLGRHATLLGVSKPCLRDLSDACIETGQRVPFVAAAPDRFDNTYFVELLAWDARSLEPRGASFIPTDVVLVVDAGFRRHVEHYARDQGAFFDRFARVYERLTEPVPARPHQVYITS